MNIEIKKHEEKYYLLIDGKELGDFYVSIGIKCSGGRIYMPLEQAEAQRDAEVAWYNNNQKNPYN